MSLLAVPIISVLALLLVIVSCISFYIGLTKLAEKNKLLNSRVQSSELLINELQLSNNTLQVTIEKLQYDAEQTSLESLQVSKHLEHRVKLLQQRIDEQEQLVIGVQNSQGQDKFYTRAYKLAEKGASIEEIVAECELPKAEVEMLLSVYQQRMRS